MIGNDTWMTRVGQIKANENGSEGGDFKSHPHSYIGSFSVFSAIKKVVSLFFVPKNTGFAFCLCCNKT